MRAIDLAQRAGREIAGIGVRREACLDLLLVQRREIRMAHVNFATHVDHARDGVSRQAFGNILHGADIRGDILAFETVAARDGIIEHAVL